jgi:hypothetical protein
MARQEWGLVTSFKGFVTEKKTGVGKDTGKPYFVVVVGMGDRSLNFFCEKIQFDAVELDGEVEGACDWKPSRRSQDAWEPKLLHIKPLVALAGAAPAAKAGRF